MTQQNSRCWRAFQHHHAAGLHLLARPGCYLRIYLTSLEQDLNEVDICPRACLPPFWFPNCLIFQRLGLLLFSLYIRHKTSVQEKEREKVF